MSVGPSGAFKRSAGLVSAVSKQVRLLQLSPAEQVTISFDPLHANAKEARSLVHLLSSSKITEKFPNCRFKTTVVCDRSEPIVNIKLIQGAAEKIGVPKITIKANNLTCLEILQICNKHITPLAVKEEESASVEVKSMKKGKSRR